VNILSEIQRLEGDMVAWRRHLHANPELGFEEHETAAFVAGKLRGWGIETATGIGRTGVVGTLRGRHRGNRSIGIRADMDALPMQEARPLPHASRVPGCMHGCGHDGHTAMLLGAARALAADPDFSGTVHFLFQPAEEGRGGALAMLADGLFDRFPCDEIYAVHNSERPLGQVVVYDRSVAAAADRFTIRIEGRGGHAATPHLCVDPIPVAARLLLDMEALPTRLTDAAAPAVVTVGSIRAGEAFNTIPDTATITGTVRCFDPEVRARLEESIRRRAANHAEMAGATARVEYETLFAPTVNTPEMAAHLAAAAADVVGERLLVRNPPPEMGSEDFSFMLQQRPGCYFLLGQGDDDHRYVAHDVNYDFNDAILTIGASLWVTLVRQRLSPEPFTQADR
jgi:hippurate hydrolase